MEEGRMKREQWEAEMKEKESSGAGGGEGGFQARKVKGGERDVDVDGPGESVHGRQPPFSIGEIRAAIPKHCWVKDPWRSMTFVAKDVAAVVAFAAGAAYMDSWLVWPVYWLAQGTMFWAIFVLGHDCGHGSFSDSKMLNSVVGHFLHSFILVPYHGWRISHRTHHQNHGHVEKDESWYPLTKKIYNSLDYSTWKLRFTFPFPLFAFPVYLLYRSPGKTGSHFNPHSDLFLPNEWTDVVTSTLCWAGMALLLATWTWALGAMAMFKLYWVPYLVFVTWLDCVTYLHHHGHDQKLPWYRGKEWSFLRGALTTVDRDYGWINGIHHDIGTHVIHHLFPQIPHYNLREATAAAIPVLGKYYRQPEASGPLPLHLVGTLLDSLRKDHFVPDVGDIVYYQTDHRLADPGEGKAGSLKTC